MTENPNPEKGTRVPDQGLETFTPEEAEEIRELFGGINRSLKEGYYNFTHPFRNLRKRINIGQAQKEAAVAAAARGGTKVQIEEAVRAAGDKKSGCSNCLGAGCAGCLAPFRYAKEKAKSCLTCGCAMITLGACALATFGGYELVQNLADKIK